MPQVRIGWRPYVDSGLDTSATTFLAAAGITDSTQRGAVNTLVKDLKRFGLWTKLKAFYPFVGGTSASHKFNLIDPRDLNEAYRLSFSGGWTHSSMGIKANGSNTSAETFLSLRTVLGATSTQHSLGIYINENPASLLSYRSDISASDGSMTSTSNIGQVTSGSTTHIVDMTTNWWSWIFSSNRDARGLTEFKRYHSKYTCAFVNGSEVQDWRNTTVSPYYNPAATVKIGSASSLNRYCTAYIADTLDSLDSYLMYLAVQKFNTTLSRNTGTGIVGITAATYSSSITSQTLVTTGMKINLDSSSIARPQEMPIRNNSLTDPGTYFFKNEIWTDASGSGNNGTFQRNDNNNRSCGYFTSDELNIPEIRFHDQSTYPAAKLYGNNSDWVDTPYIGSDSGTYTFGGWIKMTSVFSGSSIFCRGRDGYGSGWSILAGASVGGKFSMSVVPNSGTIVGAVHGAQINISGSTTLQANTWYNVYVVWKPSNFVKLYVNGALDASWSMTIPSVRSSSVGWTLNKSNSSAANGNIIVGAFHVYDRDLSAAEIMQNFNATRPKYNVIAASDADAQAFVVAAGLSNSTQISAVDTLVTSLKTAGIWTKMRAIYPFVGGTAFSHKFNLKDPRNADAAYRLAFTGGMTHSSTGVLFGASSGYADTKLAPSAMGMSSQHLSFYTRINNNTQMGVSVSGYNWLDTIDSTMRAPINLQNYVAVSAGIASRTGFVLGSRNSSSNIAMYKNGVKLTDFASSSNYQETYPIYINALNRNSTINISPANEYTFASIGDGLTDAEASSLYSAVQAFQTALGMQV